MNYVDVSPRRQQFNELIVKGVERLVKLVAYHWLALANLANFLFVFFALLAPVLMASGLALPARAIYLVYKAFCHQLPYRAYFILDYQMAFCQRNAAIYTSMLVAGLTFGLVRDRLRPIDWRLYLVLITPMAVDGFTQLFGLRESNWELRTVTGALFGAGTVWLVYPYVELGMKDIVTTMVGGNRSLRVEGGGWRVEGGGGNKPSTLDPPPSTLPKGRITMSRIEIMNGLGEADGTEVRARGSRNRVFVAVGLAAGIMLVAAIYLLAGELTGSGGTAFTQLAEPPPIGRVVLAEGQPLSKTAAPRINEAAPDLSFVDPDGVARRLSDYRGQAVMINFWASWCPPCVKEMPDIESVYREDHAKGLVVLGVNLDDNSNAARKFLQVRGITFPTVMDGDQIAIWMYRVSPIPATFFIDREGILRDIQVGAMTRGMIKKKVEKIL